MSCNNCRDVETSRAIRNLALAVILICWSVWMLIDDVQKLKESVQHINKRLMNTNDSLYLVHERVHEMAHGHEPESQAEWKKEEVEVDLNG